MTNIMKLNCAICTFRTASFFTQLVTLFLLLYIKIIIEQKYQYLKITMLKTRHPVYRNRFQRYIQINKAWEPFLCVCNINIVTTSFAVHMTFLEVIQKYVEFTM